VCISASIGAPASLSAGLRISSSPWRIEGGSLREAAESERPDPAKVARLARDLKELELAARAAREELGSEDS